MSLQGQFVHNRNENDDVVHRYPAFESCNLDDAKDREKVDARTAAALIASGQARACGICLASGTHEGAKEIA